MSSRTLHLEELESDPTPLFIIQIGEASLDFDLIFCNKALRKTRLHTAILGQDKDALLFRSWAQAVSDYNERHDFASRVWSAKLSGRNGDLKIVSTATSEPEKPVRDILMQDHKEVTETLRGPIYRHPRQTLSQDLGRDQLAPLRDLPNENLRARWQSIQTMMDMSDVGVFEYHPTGKLIHANEAWYRLSSHPRGLPDHVEYSFMDLVYPEDQALVMSMWNTLTQGQSVTFEMRWKPRLNSGDTAQWVLSSCVPVFDDGSNLISIAGNTIDINAQKKSQATAQAQVEALEQARLSERKFARFAQLSPTAIYIFVPDSGMKFVNDHFFELTGQAHAPLDQFEWLDLVSDEDVERVRDNWKNMLQCGGSDDVQFRLKKTWVNQDGISSNIWVQSSSYPETDSQGKVISIMGTLFDISQFKWAESVQRQRITEALEAKRQQENFIDMTSHELRNPLSAVVQCVDSIIASLQDLSALQLTSRTTEDDSVKINKEINTCIDSLQTIISCSLHQRRVIDDVLTLSKLDSNLILITPVRCQPAIVVGEALKMFEIECSQADIKLSFRLDESFEGMEWVMLDPSRLLQVLINLLTNAIKFTKNSSKRVITVALGGSWSRPPKCWQEVTFTDDEVPQLEILEGQNWGRGQKAYLWLKVVDSGCGITVEEQKRLFSRFSQATPRTHVKYGGSGLGLFISKSLTSLQGGAIGVHSKRGIGSTFAFFVSARLANPPAQVSASASQARPTIQRTCSAQEAMKAVRLNVLIVEDNLVNQKVLKKQLEKFGWNISIAGNGQEAIDWLKGSYHWNTGPCQHARDQLCAEDAQESEVETRPKGRLDIILMDIEMPVMDGLTCSRLIRDYEQQGLLGSTSTNSKSEDSTSPVSITGDMGISGTTSVQEPSRIPILAVSANARMEQIEQAIAAGMDDAITKPFRIPELWPKMQGLLKNIL